MYDDHVCMSGHVLRCSIGDDGAAAVTRACTDYAVAIASQVAVLARATVATTAHRERSQVVGGSWGAGTWGAGT